MVRIVLNHLGEVFGGTNSLRSSWVRIVLDHLGGTNSLRSSRWYE